jgi:hypothetical protein
MDSIVYGNPFVTIFHSRRVRYSTRLFIFNCQADQVLYQAKTQARSREY